MDFPNKKVPPAIAKGVRKAFQESFLSVTGVSRESGHVLAPNHLFSISDMSVDSLKLRTALETSGTISNPFGNTCTTYMKLRKMLSTHTNISIHIGDIKRRFHGARSLNCTSFDIIHLNFVQDQLSGQSFAHF